MTKQSTDSDSEKNTSGNHKSSIMGALAKGAVGSAVTLAGAMTGIGGIALVGPFAIEAFNLLIPNQRQNRVEKMLKIFSARICNMSEEEVEKKFHDPEFLDIFEDCITQTIRAVSDDRVEYLASVLEKSISGDQIKHLQTKRLLSILSGLNDIEIIILKSYGFRNSHLPSSSGALDFKRQHESVFRNAIISSNASEQDREEHAMFINYRDHLINMGLIGPSAHGGRASELYLTPLGNMLLKLLGSSESVELVIGTSVSPVSAIRSTENEIAKIEKSIKTSSQSKNDSFRRSERQKNQDLARRVIDGLR